MSKPSVSISHAGVKRHIPLILRGKEDDLIKSFTATGDFGNIIYTRWVTSFAEFEILQFDSKKKLEFAFDLQPGYISIGYCKNGIFKIALGQTKEELMVRSQAYICSVINLCKMVIWSPQTDFSENLIFKINIALIFKRGKDTFSFLISYAISELASIKKFPYLKVFETSFQFIGSILTLYSNIHQKGELSKVFSVIFLEALSEIRKFSPPVEKQINDVTEEDLAYLAAERIILEMDERFNFQKFVYEEKISSKRLSEIFRKYHGDSMSIFKIKIRMEKAKQLLLDTSLQIQDISLQVGYQNPAYFSKLFKQKTGFAPMMLRKVFKNCPE